MCIRDRSGYPWNQSTNPRTQVPYLKTKGAENPNLCERSIPRPGVASVPMFEVNRVKRSDRWSRNWWRWAVIVFSFVTCYTTLLDELLVGCELLPCESLPFDTSRLRLADWHVLMTRNCLLILSKQLCHQICEFVGQRMFMQVVDVWYTVVVAVHIVYILLHLAECVDCVLVWVRVCVCVWLSVLCRLE